MIVHLQVYCSLHFITPIVHKLRRYSTELPFGVHANIWFVELAESIYYVYRATHDPLYLEMGAAMVDSIETTAKTDCGYATVIN